MNEIDEILTDFVREEFADSLSAYLIKGRIVVEMPGKWEASFETSWKDPTHKFEVVVKDGVTLDFMDVRLLYKIEFKKSSLIYKVI